MCFTWLYNLAGGIFDSELASVEVCDCQLEATQSLHQADTLRHVKVMAVTTEPLQNRHTTLSQHFDPTALNDKWARVSGMSQTQKM